MFGYLDLEIPMETQKQYSSRHPPPPLVPPFPSISSLDGNTAPSLLLQVLAGASDPVQSPAEIYPNPASGCHAAGGRPHAS